MSTQDGQTIIITEYARYLGAFSIYYLRDLHAYLAEL